MEEERKAHGDNPTLRRFPSNRRKLEANGSIWSEAVDRYDFIERGSGSVLMSLCQARCSGHLNSSQKSSQFALLIALKS